MQVHLLRDIFNWISEESEEKIRVGIFYCYAPDYEETLPVLKLILEKPEVQTISSEDCVIYRIGDRFLITDMHGGRDFYSYQDARFFVDVWDKVQKVEPNIIYLDCDQDQDVH
jgi:hypothetical protein